MGKTRRPANAEPRPPALALFERVMQQTQGQLLGFIRNLSGDDEEARDLLQEVYIAAWRAAVQEKAPFTVNAHEQECRRWLFHVAYCRVMSSLRHRSVIAWESLDPTSGRALSEATPLSFEDRLAEGESLRQALRNLEPTDIACLLLRIVEGFSAVEIAQLTDTTPD